MKHRITPVSEYQLDEYFESINAQREADRQGLLKGLSGVVAFVGFMLCIPLANWMVGNVGICSSSGPCVIPVGFGLMAPSGVLVIGFALVLRDLVHERWGIVGALMAILFGAVLSLFVGTSALALAAATAFLLSELGDTLVYAPLRAHSRPLAVLLSQIVGAVLDSYLFVYLAFGSFEFGLGQSVAKIYAGVIVALLLWAYLRSRGQRMGSTT